MTREEAFAALERFVSDTLWQTQRRMGAVGEARAALAVLHEPTDLERAAEAWVKAQLAYEEACAVRDLARGHLASIDRLEALGALEKVCLARAEAKRRTEAERG